MPGTMNRIIQLLAIVLLLLFLAGLWIWWSRPTAVDMTAYVPADSLVYLEANSLTEITAAMSDTEAWRNLGPLLGMKSEMRPNRLTSFVRATGIGSTASVIASRCQLAIVMLDLNSTCKDSTLNYKPLAALVIETHTSGTRIRSTIEDLVGSLARRSFGQPAVERIAQDGHEFVKWTSVDGLRQIVVTIDGSVAIIANDIRAAAACLESRAGKRPSLAHQADVEEMRKRVRASGSLAFGYVSADSAARLLSVIAPARLGKLADEPQFQKLMTTGSAKVLGNIGWSARATGGGIEDYYFMALKSDWQNDCNRR